MVNELNEQESKFWANFTYVHHPTTRCLTYHCAVHNPVDHHMRDWPMHWRCDRGILERICQHGLGHPDPSQFDYWHSIGHDWEATHGCDSCCAPPTNAIQDTLF